MGRRKSQKKALSRVKEEVLEDTNSTVSSQVSDGTDDDIFETFIDYLYEKRAATRLQGLQGLVSLLCSDVWQEEVRDREETLTRLFLQSVRRGKGSEPQIAARGLGLLVLTLGLEDGADRLWESTSEGLLRAASSGKSELARAAIDAYSAACFVSEENPRVVIDCMDKIRSLWTKGSAGVREAAVRGWTLLLSSLPTSMMLDDNYELITSELRTFLDAPEVEVRKTAGEALALLYKVGLDMEAEEMDFSDGESSEASCSTALSRMSGMEDVVDKMKDLSNARGETRKKSKKDRATMRATFRGICNFVEDGYVQETKIKLRHGDVLVIDNLPSLIQLNFLRRLLAEGFQAHLQKNELLHQIFNYAPNRCPLPKMTKFEKRMFKSPSSATNKMRTVERGAARAKKDYIFNGDVF